MRTTARLVAMLVVVPATFYFAFWILVALVIESSLVCMIIALLCAAAVGRVVWKHMSDAPDGAVSSALWGAAVLGGIGFFGGFFGPLIFAPEANQGPLLGLLITGPLGILVGAVAGVVHWYVKKRPLGDDTAP